MERADFFLALLALCLGLVVLGLMDLGEWVKRKVAEKSRARNRSWHG